jgi:heme/copper-type cytochrome/quinol oxidase subunit 3
MASASVLSERESQSSTRAGIEMNQLGVLLFVLSEAAFFLLLILAYAYFMTFPENGPTPKGSLDPLFTGLFSLLLWASSFTVWQAGRSLKQGKPRGLAAWLVVTILLGVGFLIGQGIEWARLITEGTTISRNLFGTTFFTLTGFHGAHVIIGLLMLGILFGFATRGAFKGSSRAVDSVSIYWHFVDGVWIIIYSLIYLTIVF